MHMFRHQLAIIPFVAMLVLSCAKQVTKQTVQVQKGHEIVSTEKKDTLGYFISFYDSTEREKFVRSFEHLVKTYPFRLDTLASGRYIELKLPPPPPVAQGARPRPVVSETLATTPQTALSSARKIEPRTGGVVTLYSQREFVDPVLSTLITSYPFGKGSCSGEPPLASGSGVLDLRPVSDRQLDISLKDNFVSATGQTLSAFDCVNAWTAYVKRHPAEGSALFRYVKGLDGFVAGREAIISGFVVSDQKTISLRLDKTDPFAATRLCSRRLLPQALKMGSYYVKGESPASAAAAIQLLPNPHPDGQKAFLNSCTIRLGKDPNPFLSFSLNRYDAITIVSLKDLDYARQKAADKASIIALSEDRYFLSCAIAARDIRVFARKLVDPRDILANFVKADGAAISQLESESVAVPAQDQASGQPVLPMAVPLPGPLSILYRSDDPVSVIIAEKILADFTRAGLLCLLKGVSAEGYEASLVRKDFGIAVGWIDKSVTTDPAERLRLASMWFNDNTDEHARIDDVREIPLFSVKQYLLCKKKIQFAGDVLEGIFISDQL
jgi:hypothetical protein